MKIIPLSEGAFTVDKTKKFIPFDIGKDEMQNRSQGSLLVEIQPFVIVTDKDVLLLDTGMGFVNSNGTMQLHQNLINNGIEPNTITKVLISHLHKDHAGGILEYSQNINHPQLSFPQADYFINKKEFAFAMNNNSESYKREDFSYLENSDKLILTEDHAEIDQYIIQEMTAAHSPFHSVFWIKEADEIIFFGADVAPQLQQMKNRFIAKYDFDGRKSMELRTQWWEQGKKEHWTFLFYHDIKSAQFSL